ncbi:ATP-binding protein [Streptomyces sp. NPDC013178]|uniref:ATP-binding protein n=1 Tax=Streptomyces sp. NPDC013178 TaxID=3155118 RepID=UPI00340F56C4
MVLSRSPAERDDIGKAGGNRRPGGFLCREQGDDGDGLIAVWAIPDGGGGQGLLLPSGAGCGRRSLPGLLFAESDGSQFVAFLVALFLRVAAAVGRAVDLPQAGVGGEDALVGKTMLSVALGRAAVDAGHRVYFTTAAELAAKCHKAALEGRWKTCMRFFAGPKLLIIDELGYLPLPEDGASALFQVINQRYLKSSTILTTNVGIAKAHMFRRTRARCCRNFTGSMVSRRLPSRLDVRATRS